MTSDPIYYFASQLKFTGDANNPVDAESGIKAAFFEGLSKYIPESAPAGIKPLFFVVSTLGNVQTTVEVNLEFDGNGGVRLQDHQDQFFKITEAGTLNLIALGLAAIPAIAASPILAITGIGIATAFYSAYLSDVVFEIYETIKGTVDVDIQLKKSNGEILAGVLYKDGLETFETPEAVEQLLLTPVVYPDKFPVAKAILNDTIEIFRGNDTEPWEVFKLYDTAIVDNTLDIFFDGEITNFENFVNNRLHYTQGNVNGALERWLFARIKENGNDISNYTKATDQLTFPVSLFGNDNDFSVHPELIAFHDKDDSFHASLDPDNQWIIYLGNDSDNQVLAGNARSNAMFGAGGADVLASGKGQDYVFGGSGDDKLIAESGIEGLESDVYYGGTEKEDVTTDGSDTLDYSKVGFSIGLQLGRRDDGTPNPAILNTIAYKSDNTGTQTGVADKIFSIEKYILSNFKDWVKVTPSLNYNVDMLDGGSGNDVLDFSALASGVNVDVTNGSTNNINFTGFSHFIGGSGDDYFLDAPGSHTYEDSGGLDEVDYSQSSQRIVVSQHLGIVNAQPLLSSGFQKDFITGIEGITGTVGNDYFYVREGMKNAFFDGAGNNSYTDTNGALVAGRDAVNFEHHDGTADDAIFPGASSEGVTINLGNNGTGSGTDTTGGSFALVGIEEIIATNGNDNITAGNGSNWLFGLAGEDQLSSGDGNDHLSGGQEDDTLSGGDGDDTYYFGWRGDGGIDTIIDSSGNDKIYFMENYRFNPSQFSRDISNNLFKIKNVANVSDLAAIETVEYVDRAVFKTDGLGLIFSQNLDTNSIIFSGDEFIDLDSNGIPDTPIDDNKSGSLNDDHLFGNDGDDTLNGLEQNDLLEGGSGADILFGGAGDDALYANTDSSNVDDGAIDTLHGEDGNDFLHGSGGGDTLYGGKGHDYLFGEEGDLLFGENGEDKLFGTGLVKLDGGTGNDYLSADGSGAIYVGGDGTDVIFDEGVSSALLLEGLSLELLSFGRAANNSLVITTPTGDRVIVQNHFTTNPLEFINFGDNSSIEISTVTDEIVFLAPKVDDLGGNTIPEIKYIGGNENNIYIATGAEDTIVPGLGSNSISFETTDLESRVFLFATPDEEPDILRFPNINSFDGISLVYEDGVLTLTAGLNQVVIDNPTEIGQSGHIIVEIGSGLVQSKTLQEIGVTIRGSESGDLEGYSIDDVMIADESGSEIFGLTGDDQITGLSGNDKLYGGTGDDLISDGDGNDIVYGNEGADTLVDQGGDDIYHADTSDTLQLGAGANTLVLDWDQQDQLNGVPFSLSGMTIAIPNENDFENILFTRSFGLNDSGDIVDTDEIYTLHYGGNSLTIEDYAELSGTPTIILSDTSEQRLLSDFTLTTDLSEFTNGAIVNEGAVQFSHNDMFYGTAGNDNLGFSGGADIVYGGDGDDGILKIASFFIDKKLNLITIPLTSSDILEAYGEGGNDTILGGLGDDVLDGGDGNDFINGGLGFDTITGGIGDDILMPGSAGSSHIDGGDGIDAISFNPFVLTGFNENLVIDMTLGTVTSAQGIITFENIENAEGSNGDDHIIGDDDDNVFTIYGGNNILDGGSGDDGYIIGSFESATNQIIESGGLDSIDLAVDFDALAPFLTLDVAGFDLILKINDITYTIDKQFAANDDYRVEELRLLDTTLDLVNFTSWYTANTNGLPITQSGTSASEPIIGTEGLNDTVDYSSSPTSLTVDLTIGIGIDGYADGDTYFSIENVIASEYNDIITGSNDSNEIFGGAGNDIIKGGQANDVLHGGTGDDLYIFGLGDGVNTIFESSGFDALELGVGINFGDLTFTQNNNDLHIEIASGFLIKDFFSGDPDKVVEEIRFDDGSTFDLTTLLNATSNTDPIAQNDSFLTDEDIALSGNVLDNNGNGADTDPDGDILKVQPFVLTTVAGATVIVNADGTFDYTPFENFNGSDSFNYTLVDVHDAVDTGTVSIDVAPVNDAPIAFDDSFSGEMDQPVTGNVLDNDTDVDLHPLNAVAANFTTSQGGQVDILENGTFTYTPASGFFGTDSFDYTVTDNQGGNDTASVTIEIDASFNEVIGTQGRDNLVGTSGNDVIRTLSGSVDRMTGGQGADIFVVGQEAINGIRERDIILDYEVGVDSILLEDGVTVGAIRQTSSGVAVFLEGDLDAIYVLGDDVLIGNLTFAPENILMG